jgi:hypothetical protein
MGMFDDILCKRPMPDGFAGPRYQTKDLDCDLDQYEITDAGRLVLVNKLGEPGVYRETNFHGWLNFYDYSRDGWWRSYKAKFTDGQLQHIEVVAIRPPEQRATVPSASETPGADGNEGGKP